VQQLGEVDHDLEIGSAPRLAGRNARLRRDARRHRLPVDARNLAHQLLELRLPAASRQLSGITYSSRSSFLPVKAHVALRLLLEGDADPVPDELYTMREPAVLARDAALWTPRSKSD